MFGFKIKNIRLVKITFPKKQFTYDVIFLGDKHNDFSMMVFQFYFFGFGIAYRIIDND